MDVTANALYARNRERILEAIDQLRRRKARPNIHRITTYMFRRFAISSAETKAHLQRCVDDNIVLEVLYKGNTSYRNAAKKLSTTNNKRSTENGGGTAKATRKFPELLIKAFGKLMLQDVDYAILGVPAEEIISSILAQDRARYNANYIAILLEKEVQSGFITKLPNDNYLMGRKAAAGTAPAVAAAATTTTTTTTTTHDTIVAISTTPAPAAPPAPPAANVVCTSTGNDSTVANLNAAATTTGAAIIAVVDSNDDTAQFQLKSDNSNSLPDDLPPSKPPKKKLVISEVMDYIAEEKEKEENKKRDDRSENGNNLRVGGRRKRAKKVFDPSDTHVPKKRGRPAGSLNKSTIEKQLARLSDESRPESRTSNSGREQQGGVCSVCHVQNKRNDRMVACRECSNKAHQSCLNGQDNMMLRMYPDNTWQCPHCKTCVVCYETSDAGVLTVCSVCADAYHQSCHEPRIQEKIKANAKWLCMHCETPDELKINEIESQISHQFPRTTSSNSMNVNENNSSSPSISGNSTPSPASRSSSVSPTPPRLSPQNELRVNGDEAILSDSQSSNNDEDIDPSIPDATHWTADEVYQYFAQYFPKEAHIFKEQEIDGRSLLLLKRMDVLTNLKLKLGPALKIYKHVVKLQVRRDDPKLYWL